MEGLIGTADRRRAADEARRDLRIDAGLRDEDLDLKALGATLAGKGAR